jgi:hypothetical protein
MLDAIRNGEQYFEKQACDATSSAQRFVHTRHICGQESSGMAKESFTFSISTA